jgi:hypothetical protein
MSIQAVSWAFEQNVPTLEKFVLVALANYSNHDEEAWPSLATLSRDTSMCIKTIRVKLRALESLNLISRSNRFNEVGQTSNRYLLHIDRHVKSNRAVEDIGDLIPFK